MSDYTILGRLVESETARFVYFCDAIGLEKSSVGTLVAVNLTEQSFVCGVVAGQHWISDEMAMRIAQVRGLDSAIVDDHRWSRAGGPAVECMVAGLSGTVIGHIMPEQSIAALSPVRLCSDDEVIRFCCQGWQYLRLLTQGTIETAGAEVLAAHLHAANQIIRPIDPNWIDGAARYLVRCLSSRPDQLTMFLQALEMRISIE